MPIHNRFLASDGSVQDFQYENIQVFIYQTVLVESVISQKALDFSKDVPLKMYQVNLFWSTSIAFMICIRAVHPDTIKKALEGCFEFALLHYFHLC